MLKSSFVSKAVALAAVIAVLLWSLDAVRGLVEERQARQFQAERSVADGLAGQQSVLGPLLQLRCDELWTHAESADKKDTKTVTERRELVVNGWPRVLTVDASTAIEPRYRGLFKLNSFAAKMMMRAEWEALVPPQAAADHPGAKIVCQKPMLAVAVSDARGIRASAINIGGHSLAVLLGSGVPASPRGLHAELTPESISTPFRASIDLELAGTRGIAWTPVGQQTTVNLKSDWPHPSFAGRFLPTHRDITHDGFTAQWQVSGLATSAQQSANLGAAPCDAIGNDGEMSPDSALAKPSCVETFSVAFIDPVNRYVLNDRAVKYGVLFVVLTFVGVGLVELTKRVRVHPVQYLLVGFALTVFFLLLLSLSEQLSFPLAYLCASAACTALLTFYGSYILHGIKAGLLLGGGISLLYGALYAVLQMEQVALLLGSALLFVVLAAVMVATRRIEWYSPPAVSHTEQAPAFDAAAPSTRG